MRPVLLLAGLLAAANVLGQAKPGEQPQTLPERKDVVSWRLLAQVEVVKVKDRVQPQFSSGVTALDAKEVKVQGFMMPLAMGDKQAHFILLAMPPTCSFCLPGGPESMVEVKMKKPIAYGFDPIVVTGKLAVLTDDPAGVYYRLTDAVPAK